VHTENTNTENYSNQKKKFKKRIYNEDWSAHELLGMTYAHSMLYVNKIKVTVLSCINYLYTSHGGDLGIALSRISPCVCLIVRAKTIKLLITH